MPDVPTLADLDRALAPLLQPDEIRGHHPGDPAGVWAPSERPVRRLGLLLAPGPPPYAWASGIDALLVHRPWGLDARALPADLGVLAYHRALDDRLVLGSGALMPAALGLTRGGELLGADGHLIGTLGDAPPQPWAGFVAAVERLFGGVEAVQPPRDAGAVARVAVMGAMTDALVRAAAGAGARAYVTGQLRKPAAEAVEVTGIGVVAVGHGRSERWGLRQLGERLRARWPALEVVDLDGP